MAIVKTFTPLPLVPSAYDVHDQKMLRDALTSWRLMLVNAIPWPRPFIIGSDPSRLGTEDLRVGGNTLLGGTFTVVGTTALAAVTATSIVIGTDPGSSEQLRVGGAVSLTGAVSWYSAAVQRWSIGLSGGGGLQLRPVAGAVDTHVYFVDSGFTTRASLNVADGTLVLGTDPGSSEHVRVTGNGYFTDGFFVKAALSTGSYTHYFAVEASENFADQGGILLNNIPHGTQAATNWSLKIAPTFTTSSTSRRVRIGWVANNATETFLHGSGAGSMAFNGDGTVTFNTTVTVPQLSADHINLTNTNGYIANSTGGSLFLLQSTETIFVKTNSVFRWEFDSAGNLLAYTDASYDIGASGAHRPRNGYFSGTVTASAFAGDGSALTGLPSAALFKTGTLSTTSLTEVSLATYSLPANTLATNFDSLRITVSGRVSGGSATGTPRVKFGATYLDSNTAYSNGTQFTNTYILTRRSATNQYGHGTELGFIGTTLQGAHPYSTPAETLSGAITIDIRGLQSGPGATTTLFIDSVIIEKL